jgi:hypothetical protein
MLFIFRISQCQEEVDIDMVQHSPYILSHYWDADGVVRQWFYNLYKMKGGVNEYEGMWSMTLNHQDIERLKSVDKIDNRFFDNSVSMLDMGFSLVLCNHAPVKPK